MVKKKKTKEVTRDRVVKFSFAGKTAGSKVTEIVEFPEGTTDADIDESFNDWLYGHSGATWWDVEEEDL